MPRLRNNFDISFIAPLKSQWKVTFSLNPLKRQGLPSDLQKSHIHTQRAVRAVPGLCQASAVSVPGTSPREWEHED